MRCGKKYGPYLDNESAYDSFPTADESVSQFKLLDNSYVDVNVLGVPSPQKMYHIMASFHPPPPSPRPLQHNISKNVHTVYTACNCPDN